MYERIKRHRQESGRRGLRADLTLAEWTATLTYFKSSCAYCGDTASHLHIEHFVPVNLGGGTTASNCVPACNKCNSKKRSVHPNQVTLIPEKRMSYVRRYLSKLDIQE
jgi:5-methylcytosine-specific restriction endonuclease McrA